MLNKLLEICQTVSDSYKQVIIIQYYLVNDKQCQTVSDSYRSSYNHTILSCK